MTGFWWKNDTVIVVLWMLIRYALQAFFLLSLLPSSWSWGYFIFPSYYFKAVSKPNKKFRESEDGLLQLLRNSQRQWDKIQVFFAAAWSKAMTSRIPFAISNQIENSACSCAAVKQCKNPLFNLMHMLCHQETNQFYAILGLPSYKKLACQAVKNHLKSSASEAS